MLTQLCCLLQPKINHKKSCGFFSIIPWFKIYQFDSHGTLCVSAIEDWKQDEKQIKILPQQKKQWIFSIPLIQNIQYNFHNHGRSCVRAIEDWKPLTHKKYIYSQKIHLHFNNKKAMNLSLSFPFIVMACFV